MYCKKYSPYLIDSNYKVHYLGLIFPDMDTVVVGDSIFGVNVNQGFAYVNKNKPVVLSQHKMKRMIEFTYVIYLIDVDNYLHEWTSNTVTYAGFGNVKEVAHGENLIVLTYDGIIFDHDKTVEIPEHLISARTYSYRGSILFLTDSGDVYIYSATHAFNNKMNEVTQLPFKNVIDISMNMDNIYALIDDKVHLMISETESAPLKLTGVIKIATGRTHIMMLTQDGEVYGYGNNSNRQITSDEVYCYGNPVKLPIDNVKHIATSCYYSLFFTQDNKLFYRGVLPGTPVLSDMKELPWCGEDLYDADKVRFKKVKPAMPLC